VGRVGAARGARDAAGAIGLYQDRSTETYWMADLEERLIEVWISDAAFPRSDADALRCRPAGASTELVLPLDALFAPL
jgi:hypothetical protein